MYPTDPENVRRGLTRARVPIVEGTEVTGVLTKDGRVVFEISRSWTRWHVEGVIPDHVEAELRADPGVYIEFAISGGKPFCTIIDELGLRVFVDTVRKHGLAD